MHDHLVFVLSSCLGEIGFSGEKLVQYRQHDANAIGAFFDSNFEKGRFRDELYLKIDWLERTFPDLKGRFGKARLFVETLDVGSMTDRLPLVDYYLFLRDDQLRAQALGLFQCFFPKIYERLRGK